MNSSTPSISGEGLQDRVNRMNAWKESRRKADEEFLKKQKIRMFINDCDEIRPMLRDQLVRDSKLCQMEQIKEKDLIKKYTKDVDTAWSTIQCREINLKTEKEKQDAKRRQHQGKEVQEFLKQQMAEKNERNLKIHEEINEERKQFSQEQRDDYEREQEKLRRECHLRKSLKTEILQQIDKNAAMRRQALENDLKFEQYCNQLAKQELIKAEDQERADREHFKREVNHYLNYLAMSNHQERMENGEREKLINDIRKTKNDDEWKKRCQFQVRRDLVNQEARYLQKLQISEQEERREKEKILEMEFNRKFNEREMNERAKIREEKWNQRVKAFHYGQELSEQKRHNEYLRALEERQRSDQLKLIALERQRCEEMGREFVNSWQDVFLPMHPNLKLVLKGKKY